MGTKTWRWLTEHPDYVIDADTFMQVWSTIGKHRDRVLIAILWLTGARLGEVLSLRAMHVKVIDPKDYNLDYPHKLLMIQFPTEKKKVGAENKEARKWQWKRTNVIPMAGDYLPVTNSIVDYVKKLKPLEYLFRTQRKAKVDDTGARLPISERQANRLIKKYFGPVPSAHLFRHSHSTRMVERYGWDAYDLKAWYNWSSEGIKLAARYVSKDWRRLVKRMPPKF